MIILDVKKHYLNLKGLTEDIYPMMMMEWIVHEELHKTQEDKANKKGFEKLFKMVKTNKLRNNWPEFKKYTHREADLYASIAAHYYVCAYTRLWMIKNYENYNEIVKQIKGPYNKFENYVSKNLDKIIDLLLDLNMKPPDYAKNYKLT